MINTQILKFPTCEPFLSNGIHVQCNSIKFNFIQSNLFSVQLLFNYTYYFNSIETCCYHTVTFCPSASSSPPPPLTAVFYFQRKGSLVSHHPVSTIILLFLLYALFYND